MRVVGLKEGTPLQEGDLRTWNHLRGDALSMRVMELDGRATLRNENADEVLYILERDTGIHLPAGAEVELEGTMTVVGVRVEDSGPPLSGQPRAAVLHKVHLHDVLIQRTGDRWYRELIQSEITQFVGSIPPGRAPDHYHTYEEMICILQGSGVMWADGSSVPVARGSCIFLPRRQVHCLENTGSDELRLLGVFYPAGSPAVRYGVHQRADGSPGEGQLDGGQ
jgi:mannose-6-phosphate isomerase-like protein (cupin superfamily)